MRRSGIIILGMVLFWLPTVGNGEADSSIGREGKLNDSAHKADNGAKEAKDAGNQMISQAIPMLASPIVPVQIAGADLMSKGITELQQSAATDQAQHKDQGGRDTLEKLTMDEATKVALAGGGGGGSYLNSDTQNSLQQGGINPTDFERKAMTGQLNSPTAVLQAVGLGNLRATPDQMAQASAIAQAKTASAISSAIARITMAENAAGAGKPDSTGTSASPEQAVGENSAAGASSSGSNGSRSEASGAGPATPTEAIPVKAGDPSALAATALAGFGTFSLSPRQLWDDTTRVQMAERLKSMGIFSDQALNIFQIANNTYDNFHSWLHTPRVAFSPGPPQ